MYPWIGKHLTQGHVVRFTSTSVGTVVASQHRFGESCTGTTGVFDESEFKVIWKADDDSQDLSASVEES